MTAPDCNFDGLSQYRRDRPQDASDLTGLSRILALQLLLWEMSESMGNHDSEVVDASSVD
jgi:hypothetical protein